MVCATCDPPPPLLAYLVPQTFPRGTPVTGKSMSEDVLLKVGRAYEAATEWHRIFEPGMPASAVEPVAAAAAAA